MSEAKRNYYQQDLQDWCQYAGVELVFPQAFPLRTVLPLRVTLASGCDPMLIQTLCKSFFTTRLSTPYPLQKFIMVAVVVPSILLIIAS